MQQSELAAIVDVKDGVISNWERDLNKPNADKLVLLCKALDTNLSFLLDYKDKAPSAMTAEEAIIALFVADKGREPTLDELNMFRAMTKPVLDSLPDKAD
jgi:transcriptional regulator with XRE-family HTH domain